ncbi:MAG: sulfur carrier protein ThiS adenylyltransferase ThiF [Thermodesulfobacteriota bacterium]
MLTVNEQSIPYRGEKSIKEIAAAVKPTADLFILNGYPAHAASKIDDGDTIALIKKGEMVTGREMEGLLTARHTPGIQKKIKSASVAILGLGGLGSAVAGALAKIGIGKMLLSDYDVVEPSNLNRQHYFVDQIGMMKTRALRDNLLRMNPSLSLELTERRLTEPDLPALFAGVDVLIECFDDPAMKAACLRAILGSDKLHHVAYVGSSGMAGFGDSNTIQTRRLRPGIYICGDETSEARPGQGLMAPRVGVAAHHQANQALRIILGEAAGR